MFGFFSTHHFHLEMAKLFVIFIQIVYFISSIQIQSVMGLTYEIKTTWNNNPIDHDPVVLKLNNINNDSFAMEVEAPFFNDPGNPGGVPGEPFYGLWEYEVVELFLANDKNQYVEIELCPWGQHIVLLLNGVRQTIRHSLPLSYTKVKRTETKWTGQAIIPAAYLPPNVTKVNAYAIHGSGTKRIYEALYPVPNGVFTDPDFHRLEYFQPIDINYILPNNPPTQFSNVWIESLNK